MKNLLTYFVLTLGLFALLVTANIISGELFVGNAIADDDDTGEKEYQVIMIGDCGDEESNKKFQEIIMQGCGSPDGIFIKMKVEINDDVVRIEMTSEDQDTIDQLHAEVERLLSGDDSEGEISILGITDLDDIDPEFGINDDGIVIEISTEDFETLDCMPSEGEGFTVSSEVCASTEDRYVMVTTGEDCDSGEFRTIGLEIDEDGTISCEGLEAGEVDEQKIIIIKTDGEIDGETTLDICMEIGSEHEFSLEECIALGGTDGNMLFLEGGIGEGGVSCDIEMEDGLCIITIVDADGEEKIIELDLSDLELINLEEHEGMMKIMVLENEDGEVEVTVEECESDESEDN